MPAPNAPQPPKSTWRRRAPRSRSTQPAVTWRKRPWRRPKCARRSTASSCSRTPRSARWCRPTRRAARAPAVRCARWSTWRLARGAGRGARDQSLAAVVVGACGDDLPRRLPRPDRIAAASTASGPPPTARRLPSRCGCASSSPTSSCGPEMGACAWCSTPAVATRAGVPARSTSPRPASSKPAILVPQDAVVQVDGQDGVFVLERDVVLLQPGRPRQATQRSGRRA